MEDPGERDNRIDREPLVTERMSAKLEAFQLQRGRARGQPAVTPFDEETLRRLKSLGYVGGDREP